MTTLLACPPRFPTCTEVLGSELPADNLPVFTEFPGWKGDEVCLDLLVGSMWGVSAAGEGRTQVECARMIPGHGTAKKAHLLQSPAQESFRRSSPWTLAISLKVETLGWRIVLEPVAVL